MLCEKSFNHSRSVRVLGIELFEFAFGSTDTFGSTFLAPCHLPPQKGRNGDGIEKWGRSYPCLDILSRRNFSEGGSVLFRRRVV